MKKTKWGDYDKFLVIATSTKNIKPDYDSYLKYKEILEFVRVISNTNNDVFSHKGNIYNKRITSGQAIHILNSHNQGKYDRNIKLCATQLGIKL
jgi:hypothetical protein